MWHLRRGMISCGSNAAFVASGGAEATAFLARTSGLDTTHRNAYVALIDGLVADGIWSKLDALYITATQDSTTSLLNLVSTSYSPATTGGSSPAFTADAGWLSANGTIFQDHLATGFNPSTASSPKFTQNSGHISVWSNSTNSSGEGDMGYLGNGTSATALYATWSGDGHAYFRINSSAGGINYIPANSQGHYIASRTSSTALAGYKNGSSVVTGSETSAAVANYEIYFAGCNNNGTPAGCNRQVSAASIGAGLNSTEAGNLYSRLRTYMTAVGVP